MLKVSLLFWLVELIFVPLFIRSGWPETKKSSLYYKMAASTAFVLFGVVMLQKFGTNELYSQKILIGLCLGWVGDFFLTLGPFLPKENQKVNLAATGIGGLAFFAGHIFYILAFLSVGNPKRLLFPVVFGVTYLLLVIGKFAFRLRFRKMTFPIMLYATMLTLMFSFGVVAGVSMQSPWGIPVLCVGAFLFLLSDLTLGIKAFAPRFNTLPVRILYLTAYYVAQMLLVHSMALA